MENNNNAFSSGKNKDNDFWYVDNYVLLKDYYDRTISRIAARCVRTGNIAMEEYPFYGYILDVLEEISETGDYIISHPNLHQYVEKKIAGGIAMLKKNLSEFKTELKNNSSPEMIKQDNDELAKMKAALGSVDKSIDPTVGAGMSMDEVINKLTNKQNNQTKPQPTQQNIPQNRSSSQPTNQTQGQQPIRTQASNNQQPTNRDLQSSPFNKGTN